MVLDPGKFNLSATALESFGKKFEPEILKFFNRCGSLMQTQGRWWRSGLLYGKLSERIVQFSKILQDSCPWSSISLQYCMAKSLWYSDVILKFVPFLPYTLFFLRQIRKARVCRYIYWSYKGIMKLSYRLLDKITLLADIFWVTQGYFKGRFWSILCHIAN